MPTTPIPPTPRPRNWAWLWLSYTGFLFLDPILEPSLYQWIGTLVVFAIFLFIFHLYTRCDNNGSPQSHWLIAATFALGLITFPWNQGASCLMVYAFCFVPFAIESVRRVLALYAFGVLCILAEGTYFHRFHGTFHISWPNTFIAIFLVLVIGGGNIFFAEQKRFNLAQAAAQRELYAAQQENSALAAVAERERIARDLHDVLGHTLSVITLKAELAGRLIERDPARAATEIAEVERLARTSLSEVREAITGYRARGLAAEIEAARRTLDAAGVTLILQEALGEPGSDPHNPGAPCPDSRTWDGPATNLSAQEETVLALALREAVTNIVRHARATTCTLRFVSPSDTTLRRLIIEDDGQSPAPPREGNGLRGMRARIESIGGKLALETGSGTRLLITLPQTTA